MISESLELAEELTDQTDIEVIDLRSLYPMGIDMLIKGIGKTGRLIITDGSPLSHGTHTEVVTHVMENTFYNLDALIQRVGVAGVHIPFSPALEEEVFPSGPGVEVAINHIV